VRIGGLNDDTQKAMTLFRAEWHKRHPAVAPPVATPMWTALPGGSILCPNGHAISLTAQYCPGCGLEVPASAVADAHSELAVLDARAWQIWQQMPKFTP
jgi:hypothetical protein